MSPGDRADRMELSRYIAERELPLGLNDMPPLIYTGMPVYQVDLSRA